MFYKEGKYNDKSIIYLPRQQVAFLEECRKSKGCGSLRVFFATPKYLKMQNAFPKVAVGNSSFLHISPA